MATLNITYDGRSADLPAPVEDFLGDRDVRTLAVEAVRSGAVPGLHIAGLKRDAFDHFVVDRFDGTASGAAGTRIYLRPKVPFGS